MSRTTVSWNRGSTRLRLATRNFPLAGVSSFKGSGSGSAGADLFIGDKPTFACTGSVPGDKTSIEMIIDAATAKTIDSALRDRMLRTNSIDIFVSVLGMYNAFGYH